MTDATVERGARGRSTRSTARCSSRVNRRLEIVRRLHEHKRANGHAAARPRPRGGDASRALQGENDGPALATTGVADLSGFVLDLTRAGAAR